MGKGKEDKGHMVNIDKAFKDYEGETIPMTKEKGSIVMTLKVLVLKSLVIGDNKANSKPEDVYALHQIGQKLQEAKREIELSAEEKTAIKKLLGGMYASPLILGNAFDCLEGKL